MLVTADIDPSQRQNRKRPPISNGVLGMIIFIVSEIMFFAALISSYLVLRSGATEWPPWGQPRLPVVATAFNTLVLLASGWFLYKAYRQFTQSEPSFVQTRKLLGISILLGVFFVLFQGYEWMQLIQFGLTLTSSTYGGLFYLIIGTHALHAIVALLMLFHAYWKLRPSQMPPMTPSGLAVPKVFWYFVVGVWPILYLTVYVM